MGMNAIAHTVGGGGGGGGERFPHHYLLHVIYPACELIICQGSPLLYSTLKRCVICNKSIPNTYIPTKYHQVTIGPCKFLLKLCCSRSSKYRFTEHVFLDSMVCEVQCISISGTSGLQNDVLLK